MAKAKKKKWTARQERAYRWYNVLPDEPLTAKQEAELDEQERRDKLGFTEEAQLKLHQLKLLEWMHNRAKKGKKNEQS